MLAICRTAIPLIMLAACMPLQTAMAMENASLRRQLLALDPQTRLEEACDAAVMAQIDKDRSDYHVDRVVSYTFGAPVIGEDSIAAPGAVFRSDGNWYHLSFECRTDSEHLDVRFLHYDLGAIVPRRDWQKYDLYN